MNTYTHTHRQTDKNPYYFVVLLIDDVEYKIKNYFIKAIGCQWVSVFVCLYVCSLTPPNGEPQGAENLRDDSPWGADGLRLKKFLIRPTFHRKNDNHTVLWCES